jgi:bifunctional DNA-binding transcriptional regulator/antitoxin component of YhaV-PrlF toxin-antitoxin module
VTPTAGTSAPKSTPFGVRLTVLTRAPDSARTFSRARHRVLRAFSAEVSEMASNPFATSRYIDEDETAVESLDDIRRFKGPATSGEQPEQAGTATHHYVDLGEREDRSSDEGVGEVQDEAPSDDSAEVEERRQELAERTVGKQLYAGSRTIQALGNPDAVSCMRDGDGTRLLVPGDRDGWPTYKSRNNASIAKKGLEAFDLSRGDVVEFVDRGDNEVAIFVVEWGVTANLEAVPDDPSEVLDDYAAGIEMNELIAAAAQYDSPVQIHQRLGSAGPNNASVTKDLLIELGLRTQAGEVPDDIDERVAAIQEVTGDA